MALFYFSMILTGCSTHGLVFPGPTGSIGRGAHDYAQYYKRRIARDQQAFSELRALEKDGRSVAKSASDMVGKTRLSVGGEHFRYDCSGFVEAVYASVGNPISGSTKMLFESSKEKGVYHRNKRPLPGDLAFFDNSHDRNKNGRRDDKLTHVAIVEQVDHDGAITLVHLGSRGIMRITMNLEQPKAHKSESGKVWNSFLRARRTKKDRGPRLTGELWTGFARFWGTT